MHRNNCYCEIYDISVSSSVEYYLSFTLMTWRSLAVKTTQLSYPFETWRFVWCAVLW